MFVIGKANEQEIKEMKSYGWDVEEVDVKHFDKALMKDLPCDHSDYEPDRYDPNKLVAIFIDYDIGQECRDIHKKELALIS